MMWKRRLTGCQFAVVLSILWGNFTVLNPESFCQPLMQDTETNGNPQKANDKCMVEVMHIRDDDKFLPHLKGWLKDRHHPRDDFHPGRDQGRGRLMGAKGAGQDAHEIQLASGGKMNLPKNTVLSKSEKTDYSEYAEYHVQGAKDLKICREVQPCLVSDDAAKEIQQVFEKAGKSGKNLSNDDVLRLLPLMPPGGHWAGMGNFDRNLRVEEIGGKQVLVGDLTFKDQDRKSKVIFASPDRSNNTIEIIWFEAKSNDFKAHAAEVDAAVKSLAWNK